MYVLIVISDLLYLIALFARALSGMNVKDLITNIGSATAAGGGAPTAAPAAGAAKEEVKGQLCGLSFFCPVCVEVR